MCQPIVAIGTAAAAADDDDDEDEDKDEDAMGLDAPDKMSCRSEDVRSADEDGCADDEDDWWTMLNKRGAMDATEAK